MVSHLLLVSFCKHFQNVFEVVSVMHNFLENFVLPFKSHGPEMYQRTKALNQVRIVLNVMVLRWVNHKVREHFL